MFHCANPKRLRSLRRAKKEDEGEAGAVAEIQEVESGLNFPVMLSAVERALHRGRTLYCQSR